MDPSKARKMCLAVMVAGVILSLTGAEVVHAASAPRVIYGKISASGKVESGSGFTVQFVPAGTGGSFLDEVEVTNGSSEVLDPGNKLNQLTVGQFVEIEGQFYQVGQIVNAGEMYLTQRFQGNSSSSTPLTENMTLYNAYVVTFAKKFNNPPAVVLSAQNQPNTSQTPSLNVMQIDASANGGGISRSGFQAYLFQSPFGPYLPGGSADWTFVATGN
jgi:hypothetical protein